MNIIEYFDVNNKEHLQAFKFLDNTGIWPKGFLPDDIEIPTLWFVLIASKLAQAWVTEKLKEK